MTMGKMSALDFQKAINGQSELEDKRMRNYKNMTQEKLEEELVGIIKSNLENGVVLLDHDFNIKK